MNCSDLRLIIAQGFACCLLSAGLFVACDRPVPAPESETPLPQFHPDTAFIQDFSIRYDWPAGEGGLQTVASDRNGYVQVLSTSGLLHTQNGQWLYPGQLVPDRRYRINGEWNIQGMGLYRDQLVYLSDEAVFSHAWAGKLWLPHGLTTARLLAGGSDFSFLVSDGKKIEFLSEGQESRQYTVPGDSPVRQLLYDGETSVFWLLSAEALLRFQPTARSLEVVYSGADLTAMALYGDRVVLGTGNGYTMLQKADGRGVGEPVRKLPAPAISCIRNIRGELWFGSDRGAFKLNKDGGYDYYYGRRWLPGEQVLDIAAGPGTSVLVLTEGGLASLQFEPMTLHDKALYYEEQVRKRHIRYGFNATLRGLENGKLSTGYLSDSDNDGLWTSMYLAAEAFRYAVTGSAEALQNCRESLDAMERLFTINPVPGFPSRSFERRGYRDRLADPERWQPAPDPGWDWKATTSSDEAIGHLFAYAVVAETIGEPELRDQAVRLIDTLMTHVLENDLYLVDFDGQPTTWGRWHPDYVNARPVMVGDRKLNASNIISMLQTAYHFTGKAQYREKAFSLLEEDGYLENLLRPMEQIGPAPEDADDWSRMLSEEWNHSDDEMYFLGYWGLYRYAFNDSLGNLYKTAIIDHWEIERPEREGAWNIFTHLCGTGDFDLQEAIWYLQEYPMDLINWKVQNSHRRDIERLPENFRGQTTVAVLPPDELRIARHNANRFVLDGGDGGRSEFSAGDIWLLPYWMGRYLGVIGPPQDYANASPVLK